MYIVEATAKPLAWHQEIGTSGLSIPKRILYIDSEGWFITASDQYSKTGALWKTLAIFTAYRDRSAMGAKAAIYPFKRIFQTAMVDEDILSGFSTISYTPGQETDEPEGWYINMATLPQSFLEPPHGIRRPLIAVVMVLPHQHLAGCETTVGAEELDP